MSQLSRAVPGNKTPQMHRFTTDLPYTYSKHAKAEEVNFDQRSSLFVCDQRPPCLLAASISVYSIVHNNDLKLLR